MNIHKNARLTPLGRERMVRQVESGQTPEAVARAAGVCPRTVRKWVARFAARAWPDCRIARRGRIGCIGRRRRRSSSRSSALRRQRWTGKQIAAETGVSPATVSRILRRLGLNARGPGAGRAGAPLRARASRRADPHRHQEARPDRRHRPPHHRRSHAARASRASAAGLGWEFVHVCIDDASRIAFVQIMPDEKKESAVAFLKAPSPITQASASPSRAS